MRCFEPTEINTRLWNEWLSERPHKVAEIAKKFPPWGLFKYGDRVVRVTEFDEQYDGSILLVIQITGEFNTGLIYDRSVFGIKPEDIVRRDRGL